MMLKKILRLTNRRARLFVGLLLAGLFCVQCTYTGADPDTHLVQVIDNVKLGNTSRAAREKVIQLAQTDHIALLEYCLENYQAQYYDYTCTLEKQERIRGVLRKGQTIEVKFMESPFSVAMKWIDNAPIGDRVLYREGKYNNKMLVRPNGALQLIFPVVLRQPEGREAMWNTLRPVNMFGFRRGMENLLEVYRQARTEGDLKETFGRYAKVAGRETVVLVRYLPPKNDYPAYETKVYIDLDYLVPILIEGKNWDEELSCRYLYRDIKFNVGLREDDFRPEANEMKSPK